MSLLKRLLGRSKKPDQRIRICMECGMPGDEHKDWCPTLRRQIDVKRAAGPPSRTSSS
jgi:hypothetical protein